MSVIVSDSRGWLLDSQSFINENYRCCHDGCVQQPNASDISNGNVSEKYRFKTAYFDILTPHIVSKSKSENVETKTSDDSLTVLTNVEVTLQKVSAMSNVKLLQVFDLLKLVKACCCSYCTRSRDSTVYVGPCLSHVHFIILCALRKEERNANETLIKVSLIRRSIMKR